jgi:hypothetical protein
MQELKAIPAGKATYVTILRESSNTTTSKSSIDFYTSQDDMTSGAKNNPWGSPG